MHAAFSSAQLLFQPDRYYCVRAEYSSGLPGGSVNQIDNHLTAAFQCLQRLHAVVKSKALMSTDWLHDTYIIEPACTYI